MDKIRRNVALFGFCLVLGVPLIEAISRDSTMVLENNQFKNMVIAIHESVAEDKTLIDTLKTTMTKASQYLFTATKQRAYFKEITILLPSTWSSDPSYGVPTNQSLQFADVVITDPPKSKRSLPQTRSYSGCGKQGVHVLLTKEFLTDDSVDPYTNNSAKYFIHAFAQFRWGVFQEYAETGENQFYFSMKEGRADAIKCTLGIKGLIVRSDTSTFSICYPTNSIDPKTGLYLDTCYWKPYPTRQRATASIMDHQYIQALTTFCDDNTADPRTGHNFEAPSKHNRLCGHRSTWDVITNTPDFSNNKNPPLTTGISPSQLAPTFKVIRARTRKRRAIVAVETSFETNDSHTETEFHLRRFYDEYKGGDKEIILFHYNDSGNQLLQLLEESGKHPDANNIILITKNQKEFTKPAPLLIDEIKGRGADIRIIGHGDNMDFDLPPEVLVIHGSNHTGTTVYDHLSSALNEMTVEQQQYVMIAREEVYLHSGMTQNKGTFYVDPSLTADMIVNFHINREDEKATGNDVIPNIWLESPSKEVFDMASRDCYIDKILGTVIYRFPSAQVGQWKYTVNQTSGKCKISIVIKAKHSMLVFENPIVLRHKIQTNVQDNAIELFCDVTRGNHPVVGLNVTATIAKHGGSARTIQLWDNGAGADISKDDGIYSRYVTKLEKGTYHVTFKVLGEDGNVWSKEENLGINVLNAEGRINRRITKRQVDGAIQRHIYGGSFRLQNDLEGDGQDRIAPSRITDLRVEKILRFRKSMVLTWTAPGDDLDTGKVSQYQLLVGRNIEDVREILRFAKAGGNNERITMETIQSRKSAGETEVFLWKYVEDTGGINAFAFALRAVDDAGNIGIVSNVATAGFVSNQR